VHERESPWCEVAESAHDRGRIWREGAESEQRLSLDGWRDEIIGRERGTVTCMGEEVAAQQGLRGLLENDPRLPAVGHVRCIEVTNSSAAKVEHFFVGERPGRAIRHLVERDGTSEPSVSNLRLGGEREQLVHRSTLVRFNVSKGDPAQPFQRDDLRDGLDHRGKHRAMPRVKKQWLVCVNYELVKGETIRPDPRDKRRQPVDTVGYLVDSRDHNNPPSSHARGTTFNVPSCTDHRAKY